MAADPSQAMAVGPKATSQGWIDTFDGPPDAAPEAAREVIMVRGALDRLGRALGEIDINLDVLHSKLRPVMSTADVPVSDGLKTPGDSVSIPGIVTPLGSDLRNVYVEIDRLVSRAYLLGSAITHLTDRVLP